MKIIFWKQRETSLSYGSTCLIGLLFSVLDLLFCVNFTYFVACSCTVKPTNPSLTLNPNLVDGENSESHICTGNVGNPPGSLQIQIMRSSDSNFTNYSTLRQLKSRSTVNAGNCSFIERLSFSIDLTTDSWSNVTIRCVALNSLSLTDNDAVPSSILYTITSISSKYNCFISWTYETLCSHVIGMIMPIILDLVIYISIKFIWVSVPCVVVDVR